MTQICRLNWGCDGITPSNWINSDIEEGPGVDISCDILKGLPLEDKSIDYISSQHTLQDLKIYDQLKALRELYRILKPNGILRLSLPDLDKAILAYQNNNATYFKSHDYNNENNWDSISGMFIAHVLWHSNTRTLFTYEFVEELLYKAGFKSVHKVDYRQTVSKYPEIIELDGRSEESFYVEAFK